MVAITVREGSDELADVSTVLEETCIDLEAGEIFGRPNLSVCRAHDMISTMTETSFKTVRRITSIYETSVRGGAAMNSRFDVVYPAVPR